MSDENKALNNEEIELMRKVDALGKEVGKFLEGLDGATDINGGSISVDREWLHIGRVDIEKGIMAIARSIGQVATFKS